MKAEAANAGDPGAIRVPVCEHLERQAHVRPAHTYFECIDTGRTMSFAAVRDACNRIAALLTERGIGANDRIALLGGNSLEFVLLYLAVLRHGATLCALGAEMADGQHLNDVLKAANPRIVLYESGLDRLAGTGPSTTEWIAYERYPAAPNGDAAEFFAQAASFPTAPGTAPVGGPDDFATISYTSGTTGRPKGIVHHYSAVMANALGTVQALEIGPEDRILECRSFAWLSARIRIMFALHTGATLVIARRFSQSRYFDWIKDHDITIATAVPTIISMLVNRPVEAGKRPMPHLRFLTSSAAPLAVEHQKAFEQLYGIEIRQLYGLSESGGVTCDPPGGRKIGSAGRPSLYQTVRIVGEDGQVLDAGETGEVEIEGEQVVTGYLEYDGTITRLRDRPLRTGDVGYLDHDGYLFITGRQTETINRGGAKVSPREIEDVLLAHPDVAEAATIGVPDATWGEEIMSYVVVRDGLTVSPEELMRHCAKLLPEYRRPKQIAFLPMLPKTARDKVDKKVLLETWTRHAGAA